MPYPHSIEVNTPIFQWSIPLSDGSTYILQVIGDPDTPQQDIRRRARNEICAASSRGDLTDADFTYARAIIREVLPTYRVLLPGEDPFTPYPPIAPCGDHVFCEACINREGCEHTDYTLTCTIHPAT